MTSRFDATMDAAYGKRFWPGSPARALRTENRRMGLSTCHECLRGFVPEAERAPSRGRRVPWTRFYCSRECAIADRYLRERRGAFVKVSEDDTGELVIVLDFRCRECSP